MNTARRSWIVVRTWIEFQIKIAIFWRLMPCCSVGRYQYFRGPCYLQLDARSAGL